jgi:hypothetical protein
MDWRSSPSEHYELPMPDSVRVSSDRNSGGAHRFTAPGLYLSFHLGRYLRLEQRTVDGLWRGASLFGDIKVMLPGPSRTSFRSWSSWCSEKPRG